MTVPQKDTALRTSLCEFDDNLPGETLAETKCFRRVVKSKGTEVFFPWVCVLIWILFEDAFLFLFGKIYNKGAQAVFGERPFLLLEESLNTK